MKLLTPVEMNAVDQAAGEKYGLPSLLLMEHAALQVFDYINSHYKDMPITIVCGPGNNGGDGLALARLLMSHTKSQVKIWMLPGKEKLTADGRTYYEICEKLGADLEHINDENKLAAVSQLQHQRVIVDALFGTGLKRPIEGIYKEIIEAMNSSMAKTVSIDIPSGIDGTSGKVQGICVHADVTITFMAPKVGLFLYPAILYTGEVRVENIGIPMELIEGSEGRIYSIEKEEMAQLVPKRPVRSNKGTFGKVLTIGGSLGMSGAICLASLAAYKAGCGTVTAAVPRGIIEIVQQKLTEVMALGLKEDEGHFHPEAAAEIAKLIERYDVIAMGPGMGRNPSTLEMLKAVLKSDKPCVIDADGLYFIPEVRELLRGRKAPVLLTPHPGEMARMTGKTIEEILENPIACASEFAKDFGVILILKIEKTVIADWSGNIYINRCGNSGLAKGGSGDSLTGIIAGLLGQHCLPADAARLGVYLQTRAADLAQEEWSQFSFLASDTINYLGRAFMELL